MFVGLSPLSPRVLFLPDSSPPPPTFASPSHLRPHLRRLLPSPPSPPLSPPPPPFLSATARSLSSQSSTASDDHCDRTRSTSAELVKLFAAASSSASHLDLPRYRSLHFSDVRFSTSLLHRVLDLSPAAINIYRWIFGHRSFRPAYNSILDCVCQLCQKKDPSGSSRRPTRCSSKWKRPGFLGMPRPSVSSSPTSARSERPRTG